MTAETTASAADGIVIDNGAEQTIRFERRLAHPIDRVWAAISEPTQLVAWLADATVDLESGGAIVLRWLNSDDEGNQAVMHATVSEVRPPYVLEYSGDIHGTLRWELREEGDSTYLTFTATSATLPAKYRTMTLAGWQVHLEFLGSFLTDGNQVDWPNWPRDRWDEIHQAYVTRGV